MAAHDSTEAPQLRSQPRSQGPLLLVPRSERRNEWVGRVGEDPGNEVRSSGFSLVMHREKSSGGANA